MELYYGISGSGMVCHTINPKLFPEQVSYIINHAEDKILFADVLVMPLLEALKANLGRVEAIVVMTESAHMPESTLPNVLCYEELLAKHSDDFDWPEFDENTASGMCYTSGTTGNPKGVVTHHRGAYLNAVSNVLSWNMGENPVYLWTLPMFHCNGWCFHGQLQPLQARMFV